MEQQDVLFHERIEDAMLAVIDRCGGRKRFAAEMFPDRSVADAHHHLNACLNPEKRERFNPDQLLYIARRGREVGCHAVLMFMARELGYCDPVPIEPEDERAALQRRSSKRRRICRAWPSASSACRCRRRFFARPPEPCNPYTDRQILRATQCTSRAQPR
jgi:hypothetical protein